MKQWLGGAGVLMVFMTVRLAAQDNRSAQPYPGPTDLTTSGLGVGSFRIRKGSGR